MGRRIKSQWEFGELFEPAATRRVFTVAELTAKVRGLLETQVGRIWVSGEVSNLRRQPSGHSYFTLKDADAQLGCVLFRNVVADARTLIEDGRRVLLQGELTVYEPRGQYQLRVEAIEVQGVGALQLAFEQLKRKLHGEGLFAQNRKRPLPAYPHRIGVITSSAGAALRDIVHVVARRHPGMELVLASSRVQGEGAAQEIADAIRRLNAWSERQPETARLEVILLTRGGGSLEDLWAFNEECVARAVFESALPVISAVGHEIDFTISDFTADLRAATPSAAAEILTQGAVSARRTVREASERMGDAARRRLSVERGDLTELAQRLRRAHPRRQLERSWQTLDELRERLARCARARLRTGANECRVLARRWSRLRPFTELARRQERLASVAADLRERLAAALHDRKRNLAAVASRLELLSPQGVLARGYSITSDATTGEIVRSAGQTAAGQVLRTRVRNGEIRSVVS